MRGSVSLGRIAGISIGIHYTWLLALALIAWSLAGGFFPQGWDPATRWISGIIAALLLFASVLIHELAHSLVAKARGLGVRSITLFIFGGVSNIETEPEKPQVEFVMSVVGPVTSLILGGIFLGLALIAGARVNMSIFQYGIAGGNFTPLNAILTYLGYINILLGIFNLLPGFPLDGGRVLRSIVWQATGSLVRATNIAATVGQVFGWGFIAYGVFQLLSGNPLGGLWIAFIGWFLSSAADASRKEVTVKEHLSGVRVKDIMNPTPECVSPSISVEAVVRENFIQHSRRAVPVCRGDELAGIVTLPDVKKLPQQKWAQTPVEEVMTRAPLHTVTKDDDLNAALKLLAQHSLNQVPVVDGGRLVGLLSRADIISYLQVTQELGMKPSKIGQVEGTSKPL